MKVKIEVTTPLGIVSSSADECTDIEYEQLVNLVKMETKYLTFTDESGNKVVLKDGILQNSIIRLVTVQ